MTGRVAFVCAMPIEHKPIVKKLSLRWEQRNGFDLHIGKLGKKGVLAIVTGMGTELAGQETRRLLDAVNPIHVVSVGIAGGVDDDVPIGTLVLPEVVVNANTGAEFRPHQIGEGEPSGRMWTTDVMTPPDQVSELAAKGFVALDMETAAIAEACEERGVPWSVFRVISDGPADEVDDEIFKLANQDGTPNIINIMRYVALHPHRVPRLIAMGKNVQTATNAAADAAIAAVASL